MSEPCTRLNLLLLLAFLGVAQDSFAELLHRQVLVPEHSHPALVSAAGLLARDLSLPVSAVVIAAASRQPQPGDIFLTTNAPSATHRALLGLEASTVPADAYGIVFTNGSAWIYGQRPRSLLFAAGDLNHWRERTNGVYLRAPAFSFRSASLHGRLGLSEYVARLGINVVIGRPNLLPSVRDALPEVWQKLTPAQRERLEREAARAAREQKQLAADCHAADVEYFPLLYGNDFRRWSAELYTAALKTFPSARGTDPAASWEKGSLCPSDPQTWKLFQAVVRELLLQSDADGLYATFWDQYGIDCQCERCAKTGLNQFPNQLAVCVSNYQAAAAALGRRLVVRTWSSGAPHWLGTNWVHAPGNGGPSGAAAQVWGPVVSQTSPAILLQTKVYQADCQPDPPFSELLGKAAPHAEIAEYQITGQTTGRFYFPASTVDHTAWTMRRSFELVGRAGGVSLFPGGTKNPRYDLLADIANSINVYAWRELSWNPQAEVGQIWLDWATPIFGQKAAPLIVRALRRSESAVNRLFSALGLGNDTNSGFAKTIARREALLKYTNRYFLEEGQAALAPTLENVARVTVEKEECLRQIQAMKADLEEAAPYLKPEQAAELRTRLDWLWEYGQVARYLDESLWRYRYLRHRSAMLSADTGQMQLLAKAYDGLREHYSRMFRFDPAQQFACYSVPLGRLPEKPTLGSPMPLMNELYLGSLACVEEALGPNSVPREWLRGTHPVPTPSTKPAMEEPN